jgi:hypothetical protein
MPTTPNYPAIDQAIETLNRALKADHDAVFKLLTHGVHCNEALADDPTIQCFATGERGPNPIVRGLGLIVGLFGIAEDNSSFIWADFSDDRSRILRFLPNPHLAKLKRRTELRSVFGMILLSVLVPTVLFLSFVFVKSYPTTPTAAQTQEQESEITGVLVSHRSVPPPQLPAWPIDTTNPSEWFIMEQQSAAELRAGGGGQRCYRLQFTEDRYQKWLEQAQACGRPVHFLGRRGRDAKGLIFEPRFVETISWEMFEAMRPEVTIVNQLSQRN